MAHQEQNKILILSSAFVFNKCKKTWAIKNEIILLVLMKEHL